jgi:hypothetical protein
MSRRNRTPWLALVLAAGLAAPVLAQPLGTAFTFQAELRSSGNPVTAASDLQFRLYDDALTGTQIGPTLSAAAITPTNGRLTIELDFGAAAFNSSTRYLEIAVRSPAGSGSFTTLSPRQRLDANPVSQFSLNAANATGALPDARLSGGYSSALTLSNASNSFFGSGAGLTALNASSLSSGTIDPARLPNPLALTGSSTAAILQGTNNSSGTYAAGV